MLTSNYYYLCADLSCDFLLLYLQFAIESSAVFHRSFLIIYSLLWCFTDEAEYLNGIEHIQSTLIISTSLILNNRLSRIENLVPV